MSKIQSLDERIAAALSDGASATVDDLQSLIADVENAIREGDKVVEMERAKSLDPTVPDADAAAQRSASAELQCRRHGAALVRLRKQLSELLDADRADKWHSEASKVDAMTDTVAAKTAHYAVLVDEILALINEAKRANREVDRVNGSAPDNVHRRISKVDLAWTKDLVLPDFAHPGRNLWPEFSSMAQSYASVMAPVHDLMANADWAQHLETRAEQRRAEQIRMANYYASQTKMQEARQNADERAGFEEAQRRRG